MKKTIYILMMGAALVLSSCNKDVKPIQVERTSGIHTVEPWATYIQGTGTVNAIGDETYYQNLREWKKAAFDKDGIAARSISYIFFADYGSMAFRFADIPDSVDVINLWGGVPKFGSLDYQEMKACQEVKGMKLVGCRITRLLENNSWVMEAEVPSFMKAYEKYKYDNMGRVISGKMTEQELESAARDAGSAACAADAAAHKTVDEEGNYPEWVIYAAKPILDEIEKYGLDGYDLDYEPMGNGEPFNDGACFATFVKYLAQFIGPKSANPETLLIIDRNSGAGSAEFAPLCNFWVYQKYGGLGGASQATQSDFGSNLNRDNGWVPAQIIVTENVGDTYGNGCGVLEQMAGFQPSTCGQQYGHKGGFASFHGQRDWRLEAEGAEKGKKLRYQHHIMGIRAQQKVEYYKGE
ncbi:MAG: hypothetical protein II841_03850 [Bacteroidales bacterium]|nr:hypothetical protein [Bacteroidales bacterium]